MWSHVAALAVACLAARASADNSTWGARRALRGSQQVVVVPAANAPLRELSDFEPCGVLCKNVEDKGCVDRKLFSPPLVRPDRWMMCVKRCKSPSCPEAVEYLRTVGYANLSRCPSKFVRNLRKDYGVPNCERDLKFVRLALPIE